jgi:proteasome lid subunit RPN8/RPN11
MADIEWQATQELQPIRDLIADFLAENGLFQALIPNTHQPLVFIKLSALEDLHIWLTNNPEREHGGVLVGQPHYDDQATRYFVVIQRAIPAQETQGSSVHLQFTRETWANISGIIEESYPDLAIVGWYHSHPGLGVFMSATDQATQAAFYHHPWSLAVVVDPLAHKTGWFAGAECLSLDQQHIIPYEAPSVGRSPVAEEAGAPSALKEEYWFRQGLKKLRWLLPFGMLLLGLVIFTWWITIGKATPV